MPRYISLFFLLAVICLGFRCSGGDGALIGQRADMDYVMSEKEFAQLTCSRGGWGGHWDGKNWHLTKFETEKP